MGDILIIKDDSCLDFVLEKMMGNLILAPNGTEQDEMDDYESLRHINYFTDNDKGFLCIAHTNDYVSVYFAWYDKSFTTRKQMVALGKELYEFYTIKHDLPMVYSGLKNFYSHHSEQIAEDVWVFKP